MEIRRMTGASEVAILSRIIEPDKPELSAQVARIILRWRFSDADRRRMHDLLDKAKAGKLTKSEKLQAESYERVGHILSILKSKARRSLKARNGAS
jgi:hypothetical protein